MKTTKIHFIKIKDNGTNMVMTAIACDDVAQFINEANEAFTECGLFLNDVKIIDAKQIDGNVKGDKGRTDWLLCLNKDITNVNPIVRLRWAKAGLMWTGDFIANYAQDYEIA